MYEEEVKAHHLRRNTLISMTKELEKEEEHLVAKEAIFQEKAEALKSGIEDLNNAEGSISKSQYNALLKKELELQEVVWEQKNDQLTAAINEGGAENAKLKDELLRLENQLASAKEEMLEEFNLAKSKMEEQKEVRRGKKKPSHYTRKNIHTTFN